MPVVASGLSEVLTVSASELPGWASLKALV
jgi:hypothetical protein